MLIEFKNGKKIITHPTGIVSEYTKADLENQKQELIKFKLEIEQQIAEIEEDIIKILQG